jgi:hypothetical protein
MIKIDNPTGHYLNELMYIYCRYQLEQTDAQIADIYKLPVAKVEALHKDLEKVKEGYQAVYDVSEGILFCEVIKIKRDMVIIECDVTDNQEVIKYGICEVKKSKVKSLIEWGDQRAKNSWTVKLKQKLEKADKSYGRAE